MPLSLSYDQVSIFHLNLGSHITLEQFVNFDLKIEFVFQKKLTDKQVVLAAILTGLLINASSFKVDSQTFSETAAKNQEYEYDPEVFKSDVKTLAGMLNEDFSITHHHIAKKYNWQKTGHTRIDFFNERWMKKTKEIVETFYKINTAQVLTEEELERVQNDPELGASTRIFTRKR